MLERLTVQAGLDAERALLARVHAGELDSAVLFWQPLDRALVVPRRMQRLEGFEQVCRLLQDRHWPVLLRDTGGEPVPQSPAVVNIAMAYRWPDGVSEQRRIEEAYLRLCRPICAWLQAQGLAAGIGAVPGAFCDGRYNVTLDGRKLAGTAQRWRRDAGGRSLVLAHAAMLVDDERQAMVEAVNAFTRFCRSAPDCRAQSHLSLRERWPFCNAADIEALYRRFSADDVAV